MYLLLLKFLKQKKYFLSAFFSLFVILIVVKQKNVTTLERINLEITPNETDIDYDFDKYFDQRFLQVGFFKLYFFD